LENNYKFIIGIDPGLNTGFAVYQIDRKEIIGTDTLDFWQTIARINLYDKEALIVIENPDLNKPMFYNKYGNQNIRKYNKIAQNVGMNKKEAILLIQYFERYQIPYKTIKPVTKKWTTADVKLYTGQEIKCSQHCRDAIKLIFHVIL
jgi:hypothetical protein